MVCHWSRMRPVFSRSGRAAVVSVRSAGISGATKRALKSLAKKPPSAKKRACGSRALPDRPLHRRHRVEIAVRQRLQRADVEVARALVLECRERRVLAKNIRRRIEAEGGAEAEAPGDLAHDPPIGFRFARRGKERALPRDAPFGIGHGAGFLAPGLRRQQHMRARRRPCRWKCTFSETTNSSSFFSAVADARRRSAATPPDWCPSPTAP